MKYTIIALSAILFSACEKKGDYVNLIPIEGDGKTIPTLTTQLACGRDSTYKEFANLRNYDYYSYHIINTGKCKIKIVSEEMIGGAGGMGIKNTGDTTDEIEPNSQYTVIIKVPQPPNKLRFIVHCLAGASGAGNCSFNFKFYGCYKKEITEKEYAKTDESKEDQADYPIKEIAAKNCKTDSVILWTFKNKISDAPMITKIFIKNKGNCPATIVPYLEKNAVKQNKFTRVIKLNKDKIDFFKGEVHPGEVEIVKGLCEERALSPDCLISIDSIKVKSGFVKK